jgi:hypothetical protein
MKTREEKEDEGSKVPVWQEEYVLEGMVMMDNNSGMGEDVRRGCRRVNMVQILCTHACKLTDETY